MSVGLVSENGTERNGKEEKTMRHVPILIILVALATVAQDSPDELRDRGLEALKASQTDEGKIVEAARCLAEAAEAYEQTGELDKSTELNSYLYWCKKRMTLQQAEEFAGKGDDGRRIAAKLQAVVSQKTDKTEAAKWLDRADAFTQTHEKDPFLCAVRYFEVADRFMGAQESLIAQRKSLDLMQKTSGANLAQETSILPPGSVYLADISPVSKNVYADRYIVGKTHESNPLILGGQRSPKSLYVHTSNTPREPSIVRWKLDGRFSVLRTAALLDDSATGKGSSFVFRVVGDGKVLWTSREIAGHDSQGCEVRIKGVRLLELQVAIVRNHWWGRTVWRSPVVSK